MQMTPERFAELEALLAKATPGEWLVEDRTVYALQFHGWKGGREEFCNRFYASIQGGYSPDGKGTPIEEAKADAQLIASAVNALPDLLAELKRCREALAVCQQLVDAMETCHICEGTLCVEEAPVYCENCSWDCDDHEGEHCPTLYARHLKAKTAIKEALNVKSAKDGSQRQEVQNERKA